MQNNIRNASIRKELFGKNFNARQVSTARVVISAGWAVLENLISASESAVNRGRYPDLAGTPSLVFALGRQNTGTGRIPPDPAYYG